VLLSEQFNWARRKDLPATLSPRPASRGSAEADGLARQAGERGNRTEDRGQGTGKSFHPDGIMTPNAFHPVK